MLDFDLLPPPLFSRLTKIQNPSPLLPPSSSTDILNKANQHRELAENLKNDVLDDLLTLRDQVSNAGKEAAAAAVAIVSKLKAAEKAYRASHKVYDRAYQEAKVRF